MAKKDTDLAAVVGHPVSHSLSPEIFSFLSTELKRPLSYKRLDVHPQDLESCFRVSSDNGLFIGWNVTIPHKETVAELVNRLNPGAAATLAANVVHFKGGKATGYNTDVLGVRATLEEQTVRVAEKTAVIYGAGGAAKAAVFALGQARAARILVVNRSVERAHALCRHFAPMFPKTEFGAANDGAAVVVPGGECSLLVNATPVGIKGFSGSFHLPEGIQGKNTLAFDLFTGRPRLLSCAKPKRGV